MFASNSNKKNKKMMSIVNKVDLTQNPGDARREGFQR